MKIDAETYQKLPEHLKALFQQLPNHSRDEVVTLFPETGPSSGRPRNNGDFKSQSKGRDRAHITAGHEDSGGSAARFFYCAKASRKDRDEGLEGFEKKEGALLNTKGGIKLTGSGNPRSEVRANTHPTVKPTDLMRYLCRLVTPPGGVVLDPFMGSGSTGKAAALEGFRFIGFEISPEYHAIARLRIESVKRQMSLIP